MPAPKAPKLITTALGLRRLAGRDPAAALANPGLPLVLLEQPDWFAGLPEATLLGLLATPEAAGHPLLLSAALKYAKPAVRGAATTHPLLRAEQLQALLHDADPAVREAAYLHPAATLPPAEVPAAVQASLQTGLPAQAERFAPMWDVEQLLATPGGWPLAGLPWLLAVPRFAQNNVALPRSLGERLAADPTFRAQAEAAELGPAGEQLPPLLRQALAAAPATSPAVLAQLAQADSVALRQLVAQNPATPLQVLATLAHDPAVGVRDALAGNPSAPPALLHQLLPTLQWLGRQRLASNPSAPPALLDALLASATNNAEAQRMAARLDLSAERLADLAVHPHHLVRHAVARRYELPLPLLRQLLADTDSYVTEAARQHLNHPALGAELLREAAESKNFAIRRAVAAHPALPPTLLAGLLADSSRQVRLGAAHSPHLTAAQAEALVADGPEAQQALAANQATPPALLARLAASSNADVQRRAATNPATPLPTLLALLGPMSAEARPLVLHNPAMPPATLAEWAASPAIWHRAAVSEHPATAPDTLAQLAQDEDPGIRGNVVRHPATPPNVLAALADDDDFKVQRIWLRRHHPPFEAATRLLRRFAPTLPELRLLLQLGHPALLTPADRAALAASPRPADRLAVAALPEFREALRRDPHLLVRLAAGGVCC